MRPKTLILFIVAIGCGLIASIGVSQYMEKAIDAGTAVQTAKIYVATTEISPTERLDAKNVSLEEWPKDRIPEGAITDLKQLEEKYSRARMFKGEPILAAKLSDTIDGNAGQTIPVGFCVVGVKVDEHSTAGGLIRTGDRVDLVLFLRRSAEIPQTGTHTILRDVNVFAVQGEIERQVDKQGGARDVRTVSLLVTPKQAESVMLAKELGVLSLSLRRPGDTSGEVGSGETVQTLLGGKGQEANENKKGRQQDMLAEMASWLAPSSPVAAEPPVAVEPPAPPAFTMKIRTNNGDHTFVFAKLDGPPREEDSEAATALPPAPAFSPRPTPGQQGLRFQGDREQLPREPIANQEPQDDPAEDAGK